MRFIGGIAVIALLSVAGWFFLWPETAKLEICNAAPYTINYSVNYPISKTKDKSTSLVELASGKCTSFVREFNGVESQFYVHAQSIRDEANVTWAYSPNISSGDQVIFPANEHNIDRKRFISSYKEPFALARNIKQERKESSWSFLIYDGSFNFIPFNDNECSYSCMQMALSRAKELSDAFNRQISYEKNFRNKDVPFFIAGEMTDLNGPFNVGLQVNKAITKSIKGFPLSIRDGDVLVSMNGKTVFSPEDFYILLHQHATSYEGGIEEPIMLEAIRGNKIISMQSTYFFNRKYWGYSSKQETETIVNGVIDAVTLGYTAKAKCGAGKTLYTVAKGLDWVAKKLSERSHSSREIKEIDFDKCVWKHTQTIAKQRQFGGDLFDNAAWLSVVTPSAPRLLLSKAMGKKGVKIFGSRQTGRMLSTVAGETAETLLWTINGASPLSSTEQIIGDLKKTAPYAVAIGVVAGMLNRR